MRKSFVNVNTPMLAGVIKEKNSQDARARIRSSEYHGATGIDLHLSCLDAEFRNAESIKTIIDSARVPVLALNYNLSYDGSYYYDDEESRTNLLLEAIKAGASAADIQGYTFDPYSKGGFRNEYLNLGYSFIKGNPKEIVVDPEVISRQTEFIERIHHMGAEVLLSNHPGIPMTTEQLVDLALFLEKRNPDIIKIVTVANTDEELVEAFKAMVTLKKEVKTPVSYHCSGLKGPLTRVVNPILGGFMCFCNDTYMHNSDLSQPTIETAKIIIDNIKKIL